MVYCPKCGAKNEDNTTYCASCGTNLIVRRERRADEYEEMCFGGRRGSPIWGIIFGAIILIFGATMLLEQVYDIDIEFWPLVVILVGILIIVSAISRRRT
ncbi:MAG: zinc-ribbon domain-containing protein [Candidatus Bathyarchaeia archaeon]